MVYSKVTAIIRPLDLEEVEAALHRIGVPGLTVTEALGFGSYKNTLWKDWKVRQVRLEVYVPKGQEDEIVAAIVDVVYSGNPGDGVVAVEPVDRFIEIRREKEASG